MHITLLSEAKIHWANLVSVPLGFWRKILLFFFQFFQNLKSEHLILEGKRKWQPLKDSHALENETWTCFTKINMPAIGAQLHPISNVESIFMF